MSWKQRVNVEEPSGWQMAAVDQLNNGGSISQHLCWKGEKDSESHSI
ncbi:hypothetical protein J2S00_003726 [Caldalkalibacillus uzonensis]|uniref:Uncharacterized protein n=1 Tax=Caldalkalibacillus uzonensis TaxID=353224 RepID=A0ABU0CWU0_9BACI|nr:hypothetical protein [Caldalkalibacillus uzonensis]MDQ0340886.1 hypothetical protein [Caldalkalibacillus uzonensis]